MMRHYADTRARWRRPIERLIAELRLSPHIVWLADADDEAGLARYFQSADVLLFPSYYEGFGIPPLEAMACGCPVVASDVTTMPEVVGQGGVLVAPDDTARMADAVERILDDETARSDLIQRGFDQAATFTWERAIDAHLDAYRSAVA